MRRGEALAARRHERLARHAARCDRADRRMAAARAVVALVVTACLVGAWRTGWSSPALGGALAGLLVFVALAADHGRLRRRFVRARAVAAAAGRDLARAEGRWRELPATGAGLAAAGRESDLSDDLSILGPGSLFQLLSRCATPWGERRLADLLLAGAPAADLHARQEAARELAQLGAFRRRLEAEGASLGADAAPALDLARELATPSWLDERPWVPTAGVVLGVHACAQVLAAGAWDMFTLAWPSIALNVVATAWLSRRLVPEYQPLLDREGPILACAAMLSVIERRRFRAASLMSWRRSIVEPVPASEALAELGRILGSLSLQRNVLWWPVQALTLWDTWQVGRLARWRRLHGTRVQGWLEAVAEVEAISSLGGHAALTGAAFPSVEAAGPVLEARGMAHPLLPAGKAVANDLALGGDTRLLLLTGSNMSGKSTLLRAAGLNAVLALAGGPVTAASLRLRPCRVLTSIRISDALDEGVSLFYAEVRRLKTVVTAAEEARDGAALPVLFLVDEILRGTNTRERHLAAKAIIARLAATSSCGIVTSHDIELTALEGTVPGVSNGHFREEIREGRMTFDYRLRPGPVTTTNALAILRLEGLEVPPS